MSNINDKYNNIFIHVPKTAGTSMELEPFVGGDSHASARLLKDIVGGKEWDRYFTWGFVRNPLDRFVSAFFHQPPTHKFPQTTKGFKEFIYYLYSTGIDIEGSFSEMGHHHHHFVPQHYFLCNEEDKILVKFVGRFSNLKEDWNEVTQKIIGHEQKLSHERESNHGHYTSYYGIDEHLIGMIKELYEKDYKIFRSF